MRSLLWFVLAVLALPVTVSAQSNWPPDSATWYYTQSNVAGIADYYYKYEVAGDTTIAGHNCKRIEVTHFGPTIKALDTEYLRSDSGQVYYWRHQQWGLMFDWNAMPGDTIWLMDATDNDSILINPHVVDSIVWAQNLLPNAYSISGGPLKVQYLRCVGLFGDQYRGRVVQEIGSTNYMFMGPGDQPSENTDPIRCFIGDEITLHRTYADCDTYSHSLGLSTPELETLVRLFPNPSNDYFSVQCTSAVGEFQLSVFSTAGDLVLQRNVVSGEQLSVSQLPQGVYVVRTSIENTALRLVIQ